MKRVICLSGVSGTGKTWWREHSKDHKHLPFVDIADIYKEAPVQWGFPAVYALWQKVEPLLAEHDMVIVEGYFLKGSESRMALNHFCERAGVELVYYVFWKPLDECIKNVRRKQLDGELTREQADEQVAMIGRCWRPRDD
jgi:predicted kinase